MRLVAAGVAEVDVEILAERRVALGVAIALEHALAYKVNPVPSEHPSQERGIGEKCPSRPRRDVSRDATE